MAYHSTQWEEMTRDCHLTIANIMAMPVGQNKLFISINENAWNIARRNNIENRELHDPVHFFRNNLVTFMKEEGMKGTLTLESRSMPFEFHIEYENGKWYPLSNGQLPFEDPSGILFPWNRDDSSPILRHWTEYPQNTRVGYNGPMIRIDEELPYIFY
jgi:hypothetical protein